MDEKTRTLIEAIADDMTLMLKGKPTAQPWQDLVSEWNDKLNVALIQAPFLDGEA